MKEEKKKEKGALFIPAGIILGMGIGFLINNLVGAMFVGLGIGFLLFAITTVFIKD